jgi:hypothetical protein
MGSWLSCDGEQDFVISFVFGLFLSGPSRLIHHREESISLLRAFSARGTSDAVR